MMMKLVNTAAGLILVPMAAGAFKPLAEVGNGVGETIVDAIIPGALRGEITPETYNLIKYQSGR